MNSRCSRLWTLRLCRCPRSARNSPFSTTVNFRAGRLLAFLPCQPASSRSAAAASSVFFRRSSMRQDGQPARRSPAAPERARPGHSIVPLAGRRDRIELRSAELTTATADNWRPSRCWTLDTAVRDRSSSSGLLQDRALDRHRGVDARHDPDGWLPKRGRVLEGR